MSRSDPLVEGGVVRTRDSALNCREQLSLLSLGFTELAMRYALCALPFRHDHHFFVFCFFGRLEIQDTRPDHPDNSFNKCMIARLDPSISLSNEPVTET